MQGDVLGAQYNRNVAGGCREHADRVLGLVQVDAGSVLVDGVLDRHAILLNGRRRRFRSPLLRRPRPVHVIKFQQLMVVRVRVDVAILAAGIRLCLWTAHDVLIGSVRGGREHELRLVVLRQGGVELRPRQRRRVRPEQDADVPQDLVDLTGRALQQEMAGDPQLLGRRRPHWRLWEQRRPTASPRATK